MCDALSRNAPGELPVILANCLAHARRHFVGVVNSFPVECRYVLETLAGVFHQDQLARSQQMSPDERLRFHQQHSHPLMEQLHAWSGEQLDERKVEPNSGLGKAIRYLLKHWQELTLFLRQAGAPIDNDVSSPESGVRSPLLLVKTACGRFHCERLEAMNSNY